MKEGFAIGGGLIAIGLLLETTVGPVDWDAFAWPANIIVLAVFLFSVAVIAILRRNNYPIHFLTTHRASVPAMAYAVGLTLLMGLTRQDVGGRWFNDMLTFWPFVLIYVYITFLLGLLLLRRLSHMMKHKSRHHRTTRRSWRHDLAFLLNHGGLFVILLCATLGSPDVQDLRMYVSVGTSEWRAINDEAKVVELPMTIKLKDFIVETYDDGTPRRYASEVQVLTQQGEDIHATIDVNRPLEVDGWNIYQYDTDVREGIQPQVSGLRLVHDPWLPAVYTGLFMLLAGAVLLFFTKAHAAKGITGPDPNKQKKVRKSEEHHHHHHSHANESPRPVTFTQDSDEHLNYPDLSKLPHYHVEH